MESKKRNLALFNLAIDSKLRSCNVVAVRVDAVAPTAYSIDRATTRQKKTGRPVRFELTDQVPIAPACKLRGRETAPQPSRNWPLAREQSAQFIGFLRPHAQSQKGSSVLRYGTIICVCASLATPAAAEKAQLSLGVLTCTFVNVSQDVAQQMQMTCGFKPTGSGAEEKYTGHVRDGGRELPRGKVVLIWSVLGTSEAQPRPGFLSQSYVRGRVVPGQSPPLVGARNSKIALQAETNGGAAPDDAIAQIDLELSETPA